MYILKIAFNMLKKTTSIWSLPVSLTHIEKGKNAQAFGLVYC